MTAETHRRAAATVVILTLASSLAACAAAPGAQPQADGLASGAAVPLQVPVEYFKLKNGLKVVLSRDTTTPTAVVAVYYNIGFRSEPRDKTGFSHLVEHLMFQGSPNLGRMEFIRLVQSNGGSLNGSTDVDFTNYHQVVPSHVVETVLWAEADRMRGLNIDADTLKNEQEVVKNEARVNANQPYGGFPWSELQKAANQNWHNIVNFYGDSDVATLDDVRSFFRTFYAPNNAALVVTGDFAADSTKAWIEEYFADLPAAMLPAPADLREPRQEKQKLSGGTDALATRPALGIAYHLPERLTPEWYAFGLIDRALAQGNDSLLYENLVRKRGLTGGVDAGINFGDSMFAYSGPMLWMARFFHDATTPADTLLAAIDEVVARISNEGLDKATLDHARVKMRSALYADLEQSAGLGRADLLASFALFDDAPSNINTLEAEFAKVTPALVQKTASEYLRSTNRTVYVLTPGTTTTADAPGMGNSR